jgi:pimeloyl-ACP methyl ester carboxylesterase
MPVLVIGGDRSGGTALGHQVRLVANRVTVVVLRDTGHWLIDERPTETAAALLHFL